MDIIARPDKKNTNKIKENAYVHVSVNIFLIMNVQLIQVSCTVIATA